MRILYPAINPYREHRLVADDIHELYIEESGNPQGIPVLFLHGGPGTGTEPYHRCFFDPQRYRIILFDQRGCGKSTPHASLDNNTTQTLVQDIEDIRQYLSVDKWLVFGGSWGSTLALVYAETYPKNVLGLVLRGIFLCRPREIQWFYQEGASRLFPDYWQDFVRPIPFQERDNLLLAYYQRLTSEDDWLRLTTAKAWSLWEGRTSTLLPNERVRAHFVTPSVALSLARIECHYFTNDSFLEEDQILRDAPALENIPGVIVHGRYDVVCPLESAWQLHKAWSSSQLNIIADAGHAASEKSIVSALVRATDAFADQVS
ncbi:MAG: prolyl aminopeptidase [Gammaproteobacteria bacterium]|nr:prolyl aminopeptidase [Gammaproteobacteria bacterium]PCH64535.1 MAG: prolyl aminopeptidase [Gammaproteobacteria bacterium]